MMILRRDRNIIIFLVLIHLAGVIGFLSPYKDTFRLLSSLNIIVATFLVLYCHPGKSIKVFLIFFVITFSGYLIEVLGVATGKIFGSYQYGISLGPKAMSVPISIGFNWLLLIISASEVMIFLKAKIWVKSVAGALCLVLLDYLIEPVAMAYDFWDWDGNVVPLKNYISWFFISLIFIFLYKKNIPEKLNSTAIAIFILQFLFFIVIRFSL
jgi:bisanhydrobacterioruberin hydratase